MHVGDFGGDQSRHEHIGMVAEFFEGAKNLMRSWMTPPRSRSDLACHQCDDVENLFVLHQQQAMFFELCDHASMRIYGQAPRALSGHAQSRLLQSRRGRTAV